MLFFKLEIINQLLFNWWNCYVKYENQKTKRYLLTPYKLFSLTRPPEKDWLYNVDDERQYVLQLRWDHVGARKTCIEREKQLELKRKSDPTWMLQLCNILKTLSALFGQPPQKKSKI